LDLHPEDARTFSFTSIASAIQAMLLSAALCLTVQFAQSSLLAATLKSRLFNDSTCPPRPVVGLAPYAANCDTSLAPDCTKPDRQVHLVRFVKRSGEAIGAMTVNEASSRECSLSNVGVYLIAKQLGDYAIKQ